MSMDLEYMAVDWQQLNQLPTEKEFLELLEEDEEEWFFHLDEMDTSLNANQHTSIAWLDEKERIPEDTWKVVAALLYPMSSIDLFEEDVPLPYSRQSWAPPDKMCVCMSISPADVEKWIKNYDSIDWEDVYKVVFSVCVSDPAPLFRKYLNYVFPYLQMWRDGFQEVADNPGYGVLILYLE